MAKFSPTKSDSVFISSANKCAATQSSWSPNAKFSASFLPKKWLDIKVRADIQDKGYGNYLVTYTIPGSAKRVDYTLSVRLRGAHIQGSPFTVRMASSLPCKTYKVLSDVASEIAQH